MSKILRIDNGDYKLKVQNNGNIYLETDDIRGHLHGTVDVSGDLVVGGDVDISGMLVSNESVLRYISYNPSIYPQGLKLYAKDQTISGTNLYFVNSDGDTDEFVSRRKALAYSMIF